MSEEIFLEKNNKDLKKIVGEIKISEKKNLKKNRKKR